jgi:hypothetical protein
MGRVKIVIDKDKLRVMYVDQNLTPLKISKFFDCNVITIRNRLKEFKIPFKDPGFARVHTKRKDFDDNQFTKAYMIAFRLGDLNVYMRSLKSHTIVVRCHTTQQEQVLIMKSLFDEFGKVTISLNKGHYHVNCFLNRTFDFLLPKNTSSWNWLKEDDELMPYFIAGYVDAEGNFILNQGRARFKLDAYDFDILHHISWWLFSQGINNRFHKIYTKGDPWKGKSPLNEDLWRLNINDMVSLSKFIQMVIPFIRHYKRLNDMKICLENILTRQGKKHGPK